MHEANVQRAVKEARRKLGISVLPHELRHYSECRIIPSDAAGTRKTLVFLKVLSYDIRNN
jgi:hypothetical protein